MSNDLRASWNRLCDSLKESADYIFDPELGVDASEQAEGLRHHLRMLYWAIDRAIENTDPDHPELGWVYPSKVGQDNPDGVLRVVISHQEPGIENWIALGGCPQGAITYRWNNADGTPVPSLRLMPVSDIDGCLHPDTPRISTDDRAAIDAERRRHALRRFLR